MDVKRILDETNRHELEMRLTELLIKLAESQITSPTTFKIPDVNRKQLELLTALVQDKLRTE